MAKRNETTIVDMLSLEFMPEFRDTPVTPHEPIATPPAEPAPRARSGATSTRLPKVPGATSTRLPKMPPGAAPAAAQAAVTPAGDANLILEVLPYLKLRSAVPMRRLELMARSSLREVPTLDALVLQRLLGWLAANRPVFSSQPTSFTVNLSVASLEDAGFVAKIAAALNTHGIGAETLGFEIAETLCTERRSQVERFMSQCEKIGSWIVVDQFSLDAQVLPMLGSKALRLVKIDPKFTSAALKDKLAQARVVAAVQAAKVMGVNCSAKKVDSQAALQWLAAIGCDFAQGSVVGGVRPLESLGNL